ncbi:hypothetical protein Tco_1370795 [Tanacetum coccineum]
MAEYSQKWHNGTSRTRSTETSDGLAAIQAQLNSLGREIKKVNEKVYDAQVGCELCKGPNYTKDCPFKEEGKTLEEAYYTQFGAPYQPGGQYRAAGPGFYQRNNRNSSYPDQRQTMEESLTKFMAESAKRHEENSNIIKEIRASTDAAIRNQGASIKTLEIQIGQMSKVLQERGFEILHSSTEMNPRDHVKSFLTAKADSTGILPFPRRLHDYCCDEWKEARELKILETYSIRTSLMRTTCSEEKDPGSFTLPCFIHNVCFDKALVDLGASTIILDIPEDDDVPLILGRPFLSTAHAKIDVFKRKITLRVGEEKIVFKSIKPATSIIRRVYMLKTNLDSKTELIGEDVNKSFNPHYGDYIKLNDLDVPSKPRMNQDDNFKPTIDENVIVNEPTNKCCTTDNEIFLYRWL